MLNFMKKNRTIEIKAPVTGKIIPIEEVDDKVFSEKMLGDGFAIIPEEDIIKSPCNGKIVQIFPTNHAIGLLADNGLEILIHIGMDTVELNGKGFERIIQSGDKVRVGDELIKFDRQFIKEKGKSIVTPVVITNMEKVDFIEINTNVEKDGTIIKVSAKK
ncbi:PTS sugar transporter subunit IIA [Brassicibacter mesophilus]|uniref:PTS sugar transporter subunit IIA n=1 Tax=Brassicibacter mesophilus TaxID=745119 RepID=UPI003D1C0F3E